ncbi:MAG: class II aldolase/adducin family protein [Firmicutes bacterium]|nr:class II aldolase/adducin family protein [Bacillota bacterium]
MAHRPTGGLKALRERVLQVALKMSRSGMAPATWGNVSGRDPGTGLVVITPSGMPYEELSGDDMCVVDVNGAPVECRWKPSTETPLHCIFYRRKPGVWGIAHTHSLYATAFACAGREIPVVIATLGSAVGGAVSVAPYFPSGSEEFGGRALEAMGDRAAVLLGNHWVVATGSSVDEAYTVAEVVENAARIYAIAVGLGTPGVLGEGEVQRLRHKYLTIYGQKVERK